MSLDESRLENKIINVLNECQKENDNPDKSKDNFAAKIAQAIIEELRAADVIGTCPPNGGPLVGGKIQ